MSGEDNPGVKSLVSRLYTDQGGGKASSIKKPVRGNVLSTIRTKPLVRKQNELIAAHLRERIDFSAISGEMKHLMASQSSPQKKNNGDQSTDASKPAIPIKSKPEAAPVVPVRFAGTFMDSLNLSAKEKFDLHHVPQFFMYLQMKPEDTTPSSIPRSVYDLRVVPAEKADRTEYFTLSKEGVTLFCKDASYFSSLTQWEREYKIFNRMANINFFKLYKRWKAFTVWKKGLSYGKLHSASKQLQTNLFFFTPPLRAALLGATEQFIMLANAGLISIPANETMKLDGFLALQQRVHADLRTKLDRLSLSILTSVRSACDEVVDQFLKVNNIVADHKMTFMERASLRAECKRLTRFLRLVDIMMASFFKTILLEAVENLTEAVSSYSLEPFVETTEIDLKALANKRLEKGQRTPLFEVVAQFQRNEAEKFLQLVPSREDFVSAIKKVVDDSVEVVSSFSKVFSSPDTEMYVMPVEGVEMEVDKEDSSMDTAGDIRSNVRFIAATKQIENHINVAFGAVESYVTVFTPFANTYLSNLVYASDVSSQFENSEVITFQTAIQSFHAQALDFQSVPRCADVGVLFVDSASLKALMIPSPALCLTAIKEYLPHLTSTKAQELLDEADGMNPIIAGDPSSVESYVLKKATKDVAAQKIDGFKTQQFYVNQLVMVLEENELAVPDNIKALIRILKIAVENLEVNIQVAEGKEDDEIKKFTAQINEECPKLRKKVAECRLMLDSAIIGDPSQPDEKVLKFLSQGQADLNKLKDRCSKLQDYQGILKIHPVDEFEELDEVANDLNLKIRLWMDKAEWFKLRETILNSPIRTFDVAVVEKELQKINKTAYLAAKNLPTNRVAPILKDSVDEFNPVLPVVRDLRSSSLQDRHWQQINKLTGIDIQNAENFTLFDLIDKKITDHQEAIATIATAAQQESLLEEMMFKINSVWDTTDFEVKSYKDIKDLYILGDTSEVVGNLDDSLVTINTILGSRYVAGIRSAVDALRAKLMLFQETLDEWLNCQKNWMYLETIFSSPDIVKQLPVAAKTFQLVDKFWKQVMKSTYDDPNALRAGIKDKNRLAAFKVHNENLDKIQKELEDYLETKRKSFPRFYFLSNDELLEILSQAKDPRAVQPHLRKCFDNLVKLEFGAEEGSLDIIAMFSSENEKVNLGRNLVARGNVESWLKSVEDRMRKTLQGCMKMGLLDYDTKPRDEWIACHPGQIIATVAQMTWARDTEAALRSNDPIASMQVWSGKYKAELQKLIVKIRGNLSKLVRYIIVALVTTDVHARDIIDELREKKVTSVNDFLWQQQLRYYWDFDADDCIIKHSDALIKYGYEYMGATSRLVITPLTDRCWLTLTGSFALKLGAAPAGPAGTGKTESSKDLAKAIGIQCVVFNCSDQIDYKMMGKLFRGLAQGGSWVCLDEFNRIDIEVLSVVAQQLLVLRNGRQMKKDHINFMGITISLQDHHVIITMNPGYAGRTELPDNLAVCFRPVSMMVPNYALIAEIMLFAEGFGDAKNLSQKMCKLYILCSEQLSQQPHYDYGLRAVKSVLVMAGGLKRANPDTPEELVLIRALRDSNVPKFLADDLPLFAAIVQDLFPGVSIPSNDYGELQVALEEEILKAGLQLVPNFIKKVIQMFDIFNIRFGATLVGPAGTGKSTCYRILAALMVNLREKGSQNSDFQKVKIRILNPKCISMGELYGEFSVLTQEWHDGLASSIMREFAAEEGDEKRWTVFDGPIDALWIENMNTVLDDNMTLCLANGQRIKLKSEMKCLFEVNDLAVASPATVSRIGVVYITPSDLGWMPFVRSWVVRDLPKECPQGVRDHLLFLFDNVFAKGLAFQRRSGREPIETVDIQLVISLCTLFQALFLDSHGVNFATPLTELKTTTEKLFFFSYVWSVGASCSSLSWDAIDENTREIFEAFCPAIGLPISGTVFDFFLDVRASKFNEWSTIVPSFEYDEAAPYFNLVVPTTDTCRFSYVMKALISVDKPCFISGVTGTGKTVAVQTLLNSLQPLVIDGGMGVLPIFMNFSAQTQSLVTQMTIENKLEKKRKNLLGAPSGRKVVVFVDDINMPNVETYGAQPPVELLRQFLDFKGFYDRDKLFWKDITDVLLFVGAAPPGGGRSAVTQRFSRHFNVLCIPPASSSALSHIFESILSAFLGLKFPLDVQRMCSGVVAATIEVYSRISEELLPTPSKFHYLFNLRDISKVFQGMLMIKPKKCENATVFGNLWVHESMRIFYDRLINTEDQQWFKSLLVELCSRHLKLPYSHEDLFVKPIVFADFLKPDIEVRLYEEVKDLNKLTTVLNDLLEVYNVSFPTQMNLVFFTDALTHAARISRILRQPRGNIMLIGVGGSGKQSLTTIAAFVGNMTLESIKINRGYGIQEFREDIKKYMMKTGVEGKDIVFLFTDSQIVDETMLEDLNNVLNTGEIPNLFAQDETDRIVSDMVAVCKADGIPETRDNCLAHFVSRVRDKLHIVLCMSPVGDSLRIRCRQFPSLINCTTIDWFHGWPEAALVSVAERFLASLELPNEIVRTSVVTMCGYVHRSIETTSERFYAELRRRVYTTPKSYLDLISLYMSMLTGLQDVVETKSQRMKVGVEKLIETNLLVDALRADLVKLEPILKQKTVETELLLAQVAKDSAEAGVVKEKVQAEELTVGRQAEETSAVAADAQADLDKAIPALEGAMKALKSLTKNDITEVKSFTNPPPAVQKVMEAVCCLLGQTESWESAKKLLGQSNFMEQLQGYDKDNIPDSRLKNLRKNYINLDVMQEEVIAKVSKAGLGLCQWVRAINGYADVAKEVGPKKERLDLMNAQLALANSILAEKRAQLKDVMDKVADLQRMCDETLADKNRLQADSETTAKRLMRAEKLTSGLNSEGERWKNNIITLSEEKTNLIGDCFLSCACISYYGGFTGQYRDRLISDWLTHTRALNIPSSEKFALVATLGNPVQIREWQNQGLPTDDVSVNNGILVDKCRRWPLMIDPQQQANKWLKKKEEAAGGVEVTTMRDPNLLRVLETCIRNGKALIIEDLGEQIEPALEPVLQKAVYKQGNRQLIRLGDSEVDFDENFKLYMTTKLPNPHYLPEVCIKVTLINFTVTMEGLEAQLLGTVVAAERPDIERKKVQLLLQMADDKRILQVLEATILQKLSDSSGNILDNEELINTLSESKLKAIAIGERVAEAEITEVDINEARGRYQSVATRGSIIYFVIADLASIDPMYQYSLEYYAGLFNRCIADADLSTNLDERLKNIIEYSTLVIYENICRGLFEKDKLLFSASICFQILLQAREISPVEWNLFMRGPGVVNKSSQPPNPHPEKISNPMWDLLYTMEQRLVFRTSDDSAPSDIPLHLHSHEHPFSGLCASIESKLESDWLPWMASNPILLGTLPEDFIKATAFQRLLLVKALREDKIQSSIAAFVGLRLGPQFATSPNASMEDIYRDLDNKTPCIFILSTGADPTGMLLRFARKRNYEDRLQIVSLGQGQGPVAQNLIYEGMRTGDWVILQNCMLAKSWMGELDRIVFDLGVKARNPEGKVHPDFRLFLTSAPASYFPVSVLQIGVKMTNEPPKGFKANLTRSFGNLIKADDYENCLKPRQWKKLLCGLAFFHANIQERRKFGPLGWNIRYAFDESDLETSIAVLRRFLEEQEVLPWDALNYVTGQINYGGRVTDDWDRRCLMSILSIYMVPSILEETYKFSSSGVYFAPLEGNLDLTLAYFENLPDSDDPEVFGMHENANVTFNTNESLGLMTAILSLQPRASGGGSGLSSDDIVNELASSYEMMLPAPLLDQEAGSTTFVVQENGLLSSLAICLAQEIVKFNRLLSTMASSLRDIKQAIKGMIIMSSDLDSMYTSFLNNQLPSIWERVSFASLKTLGSWMTDLIFRVSFMRSWLINGQPAVFPLPVFFFPQGFMTASLQTFARRHMKAIDALSFAFEILTAPPEEIKEGPEDGVFIYGLYLEGARFDRSSWQVTESEPGRMYDLLPVIHFKPAEGHRQEPGTYACPVYKTAVRKGVLSTTGMSTNFVVAIELPTECPEQKWILAGVAALCNLTD